VPVLAEGRQTVAFCGPQPPDRITSSISAPVDDCGNCGQAVCKNFRIGFPAKLVKQHLLRPIGVVPGS